MKKLTENLIQQRLKTCTTDLEKVLQINITGRELQDVSLLKKMTGVEILSLSVNHISSLSDFQFCKNLKELYLRNNNVSDLRQIYYLSQLPKLKLLTLSQNPCANDPQYRATIIKNLQHLTELDGVPISPEERQKAMKSGVLFNSNSFGALEVLDESQPRKPPVQPPDVDREPEEMEPELVEPAFVQDAGNAVVCKYSSETVGQVQERESSVGLTSAYEVVREKEAKQPYKRELEVPKVVDSTDRSSTDLMCRYCKGHEPFFNVRIIPKNSNLLAATLNLIKELDYPSLKILQVELTSLLNAFEVEFVYQGKK